MYVFLKVKTQVLIEGKNWTIDVEDQNVITKFGDMPRATAELPIEYSRIRAQPTNQATLIIKQTT